MSMSVNNYTVIGLGLCSMGAEILQTREYLPEIHPALLTTDIATYLESALPNFRVPPVFIFPSALRGFCR